MDIPNVYIIHDASLDGYLASHILYRYNKHYVEHLNIKYIASKDNSKLPILDYQDAIVFILGIDYPVEIIRELADKTSTINIFGSFNSEIKKEFPELNINVSSKTCTSMLVWGFYYAYCDPAPRVITLLENYTPYLETPERSCYFTIAMVCLNKAGDHKFLEELFTDNDKLNEIIEQGKLLCKKLTIEENTSNTEEITSKLPH